jgi:hypothetical protein
VPPFAGTGCKLRKQGADAQVPGRFNRSQTTRCDFEEVQTFVALEVTNVGQSGGHPFDKPPLPHRFGVNLAPRSQELGSFANQVRRVSEEEGLVVFAHWHTQIMRPFGPQPFGIDELEGAPTGVKRVPAVSVSVYQHRSRRIVRRRSIVAVPHRALDDRALAWSSQFIPCRRDVVGQPRRLLGTGRKAAVLDQGLSERAERCRDRFENLWN